ncbi:F0F1-type ATP synthase assembly protein I [Arthrobacter sp. CAN_A2]|uniref:AtpZ/AtpI family protein n=1 Tax=Arthrobacter sp. CAN_A2 TaxID=2787718 RepID=UPI0018EF5972
MAGISPGPDDRSGVPPEPGEARFSNGGYNAGIAVLSYMIGGIAVWSLIGWGLDNLLDTRWLVLAGAFLGAAGGFYLSHMHNLTRNHTPNPQSGSRSTSGAEDGPE